MVKPTLQAHLSAALAEHPDANLCVALSGGPDSSALLHALAAMPAARERGLRALHVDHGLHPDSRTWARHAVDFCATLDIRCDVQRVTVDTDAGKGLEAAARDARYAALAAALQPGEWLLLGHHRDDQVETVLLKLLRGAGPEGLGGMREQRPLGAGQLWRPLLGLPRATLQGYVDAQQLACIDDPANADTRLSRNVLRHQILPRIMAHWPHALDSIEHSASLCHDAADALRTQWLDAWNTLHDEATDTLQLDGWLALAPALREPLLAHWLHSRGLPAPTTAQRRQIERQAAAQPGRVPCIRWPGAELHLWKGHLWALAPPTAFDRDWQAAWDGAAVTLPDGGRLELIDGQRLSTPLVIRLRQGGEHIKPHGDPHTRELRDLFQQGRVPPWQRQACPMLWDGPVLVGVADRWLSALGVALLGGARALWTPGR